MMQKIQNETCENYGSICTRTLITKQNSNLVTKGKDLKRW